MARKARHGDAYLNGVVEMESRNGVEMEDGRLQNGYAVEGVQSCHHRVVNHLEVSDFPTSVC